MGKKQFVALADAIRPFDLPGEVLAAIAQFCKAQNQRFDADLWMDYLHGRCGPGGKPIKTALQGATK